MVRVKFQWQGTRRAQFPGGNVCDANDRLRRLPHASSSNQSLAQYSYTAVENTNALMVKLNMQALHFE